MNDRIITKTDNLRALVSPESLPLEYSDTVAKVEALERKAETIPVINTEAECGTWTDFIADIDELGREIEPIREEAKAPYETAVKTTNGFFFGLHAPRKGMEPGRLQIARQKAGAAVTDFLNRLEAQRRAKAKADFEKAEIGRLAALKRQQMEEDKARAAEEAARPRAASNAAQRATDAEARADVAEMRGIEAQAIATALPGDLTRVTSDGGTKAKTEVEWTFKVDAIRTVKGGKLWAYVAPKAIEAAIAAYIKENAPKMITEGEEWQPIEGVKMIASRKLKVARR